MKEYKALKFTWCEVGGIIESELEKRLLRPLRCEAKIEDESYWSVQMTDMRLTTDEIHVLCEFVGADEDMRIESEPENGQSARSIGMRLSLALLQKRFGVKAEEQRITEQALWLIGVEKE